MRIIGYVCDHILPTVTQEDTQILDAINIAFGTIGTDSLLNTAKLKHIEWIKKIKTWNPQLKIILSVGGWGAGGFSIMARTEEGRRNFVRSCKDYVDANELDGIDIDWEYPCSSLAEIDADPTDKQNFTLLLAELRKALGTGKTVSIAAGAGDYFVRDTEMDKVAEICDYVQLMTYDMRSGFCKEAGHHTAPYPSANGIEGFDTLSVVRMFMEAGVPAEKLVIGAAFYARRWDGVPDIGHGLFQKAETVGLYSAGYTDLVDNYINKNGYVRYWDETAHAPYLFNGSSLISYDDPDSLNAKCDIIEDHGLLGIMYWEHGSDRRRDLLKTLRQRK